MTMARDITQDRPVHFKVVGLLTNRIGSPAEAGEVLLRVEYVNMNGGLATGMTVEQYTPFEIALGEAAESQAVYWVDLSPGESSGFLRPMDDTTTNRILKAVRDGQIVPSEP